MEDEAGRLQLQGDLVLAREDGRPWHPGSLAAEWRKKTHEVGRPVKFHNLRHTHATLLLANGEHPKVVQERLGHSSIGITMDTYSHVIPSMQEAAAGNLQDSLGKAMAKAKAAAARKRAAGLGGGSAAPA